MDKIALIQDNLPRSFRDEAYKRDIPVDMLLEDPGLIKLILGSETIKKNNAIDKWLNLLHQMKPRQLQRLRNILLREKRRLHLIEKRNHNI